MNIVVVDAGHLAGEADFPEVALQKYGWQQYPQLAPEEVIERCWRADVIVSVNTPIDAAAIDKAFKLQLIIAAGDNHAHIDREAGRPRGITVCHVPGLDPADPANTAVICREVIDTINAFIRGETRNRVE